MKILVLNLGPIYPVRAMSQARTNHMIRSLSKSFVVDLATTITNEKDLEISKKIMNDYGGNFYSLGSIKPKHNKFKKRIIQAGERIAYFLVGLDPEVFQSYLIKKNIKKLILENHYQIVISNYWENSLFFTELSDDIYKILDPHYAVDENIEIFRTKKLSFINKFLESRRLLKNKKLEYEVLIHSNLILPLSTKTYNIFKKIVPNKELLLIPDGTDVDYFSKFPTRPDEKTILFYGAMSSRQNVQAFFRFYHKIFPYIKKEISDVKVLIVGDNPIPEIKSLHDGKNIIVTGYLEDVRPWLAKAWFKILPLELGSGFRGRIVEVMSMGIPVIGTHNALDCIGMENGKHGFVSNDDNELINYCLKIMTDKRLRNEMSVNAKKLMIEKYSLDNTFGQLEKFLIKKFLNERKN